MTALKHLFGIRLQHVCCKSEGEALFNRREAVGIAIATALVFVCANCSNPPDPRRTNFRVDRGNVVAQWDDKTGRLRRLEVDTDKNGKIDTWTYMDGTRIHRIEIDRDQDGMIDRWEYYVNNALEKVGTSTRGDGVVDEWAFQGAGGVLARVETDTDRDGRVDKWEFFDPPGATGTAPVLRSVELDPDSSGHPTRRLVYGAKGVFERVEKIGTEPRSEK